MRQSVKDTKRLARQVENDLPATLLRGQVVTHKPHYRKRAPTSLNNEIEASYDQLEGEWRDWLEVARRYEYKVPSQDRYDMRHTIIIELAHARQRDSKPIPLLRAYKIASLTVALYWREALRYQVKVCIYNGLPVEPYCQSCEHKPQGKDCPYLAVRPVQSLDSEATDYEGNKVRLMDTIADDKAIDLDAWLDAKTWRLGCPKRLIDIATKKSDGIALNHRDEVYYLHQRQKELKKTQQVLTF